MATNRDYATTFLFDASLDEAEKQALIQRYVDLIQAHQGKIREQEPPLHRQLAYPIQKKTAAIEQHIEFEAPGTCIAALEAAYKQEEKVLRFLTVKLDKHAIRYKQQQKEVESPEV